MSPERAFSCPSRLCPVCIYIVTKIEDSRFTRYGQVPALQLSICGNFGATYSTSLPFSFLGCKIGMIKTIPSHRLNELIFKEHLGKCLAFRKYSLGIHCSPFTSFTVFSLFCLLLDVSSMGTQTLCIWNLPKCLALNSCPINTKEIHSRGFTRVVRSKAQFLPS